MNKIWSKALLGVGLMTCASQLVLAQEQYDLKPLQITEDINSVDLLSGLYYPKLPVLSIPAAPRLSFETLQQFDSKIIGSLHKSAGVNPPMMERTETFSLTFGGKTSESFSCINADCIPADNTGSRLRGQIRSSTSQFIYTQGKTGIRVLYSLPSSFFDYSSNPNSSIAYTGTWYASEVYYPDGEVISISYDTAFAGLATWYRPVNVSTNLGYSLSLTYQDGAIESMGWSSVKTATLFRTDTPAVALAKFTYTRGTPNTVTDLTGRTWSYTGFSNALGAQDGTRNYSLKLPSDSAASVAVSAATLDYAGTSHNNFVTQVVRQDQTFNYAYTAVSGSGYNPRKQFNKIVITGPLGYKRTIGLQVFGAPYPRQLITSDTDSFGNVTNYTYSGTVLESITFPEGNKEIYQYDENGNIIKKTMIAKAGSGLANREVSAYYSVNNCRDVACYRPDYTIDARGYRTDYSFDPDHGGMLTKLEPAASNGLRRLTTMTYTTINGLARLQRVSVCAGAECGTVAEQVTEYTYWGNTSLPQTVTVTNGARSLTQVTSYNYDDAGYLVSEDGPLAGSLDTTYYRYDNAGRKTWQIGPQNLQGYRKAIRYSYRAQDDQISKTEDGILTTPTSTALMVERTAVNSFDSSKGLISKTESSSVAGKEFVTQFSYDALNRLSCETTRMNPAAFDSLPASACSLGTEGSYGPDRVVQHWYDTLSRLTKTKVGVGTVDESVSIELTYTSNGQVKTRKDGNGNTTSYTYDGFDRLKRTTFADSSYEENSYDANDNLTFWRKRDGTVHGHSYDALNLRTETSVPGESSLSYAYNGKGQQTSVSRDSQSVVTAYDGLGRIGSSTVSGRTLGYQYDAAGRRRSLTYPDGIYLTYSYDDSNALQSILLNGSSPLVSYLYTNDGKLSSITRANGRGSVLEYHGSGLLKNFDHPGVSRANFQYNPARQLISRITTANYQISIPQPGRQDYVTNELNQYSSVAGRALTYDNNGNLKSHDGWTYNYNGHNRLTSATKTGTALSLDYDATGRLHSSTLNGSKTTFLYDGDELVAEYNASGTLLRRYVHGVGSDDPLVWFEGTGTTSPKYLLADERGSIVSETNASGSVVQTHQYGPYGEPINSSTSRFRYTGQILIPGTELYHYKARVYHPKLGRFLQTDPIGYQDGMNWYAYVGNDPMNKVDPDGQVAKRILTEAQRLIRNAKAKGRREALKEERKELQETGESRSQLTPERQKELLDTGKLKNMDGHHEPSVSNGKTLEEKIKIAENPKNIRFLEKDKHRQVHKDNGGTQKTIGERILALPMILDPTRNVQPLPNPFSDECKDCI